MGPRLTVMPTVEGRELLSWLPSKASVRHCCCCCLTGRGRTPIFITPPVFLPIVISLTQCS